MEGSQFLLKWNNHQPTVVSVLDYLLNQEAFVDVTLACEGQSFLAHKVVLSACSTYFQDLLIKNPCKHPIIFLKDVRSRDVASLLQFMYRGEINVQQDDLPLFLKTAESLQIKGLADSSVKSQPVQSDDEELEDTRDSDRYVIDTPPLATSLTTTAAVIDTHPRPGLSAPPIDDVTSPERTNHSRSLLASALGKLAMNRSSTDGATDAETADNGYIERAGPSRLSVITPPPAGVMFPFGLSVSPNGLPSGGGPGDLTDWAGSGASAAGSVTADSPERSPENGDVNDSLESPEKGVISIHPAGWKNAQIYPQGRGRPRSQPLPRMFECNLCGKTFNNRRRDRFLAHLRLHTGERPFKCLICGRGFNRQDHVTVHMRLHTGGKPFQCIVCKNRFAKQQELKAHPCVGPLLENGLPMTLDSAMDFRTFRSRDQLNGSPPRSEASD